MRHNVSIHYTADYRDGNFDIGIHAGRRINYQSSLMGLNITSDMAVDPQYIFEDQFPIQFRTGFELAAPGSLPNIYTPTVNTKLSAEPALDRHHPGVGSFPDDDRTPGLELC